jgi:pilus assembly protein FimV
VGQPEARQTLVAQSKDFNAFKQRLAEGVPERAPTANPTGRAASGQVQTRVEDKKPAAAAPDKLTLSKGAVDAPAGDGKATEDRIARERAQRDAAARAAEIDRNIADLKRLGSESAALSAPAASAASAAASGAGIPVAAAVPAPAAETASAPAADAASAPASAASAAAPKAPAAAESDTSALLENPALLGAAGGVLALLLGWALYRRRRQARAETLDPATHDRLPPDSFFGGSGGQHIDTAEAASSMMYSPSQIDAAGDVDPVAEADVYLAYGRDLQAEEILREALRTTPQRVAIHAKLLEILARRNDPRAFEPLAREALALTGSSGPVWEQIASLGQEIDPGNPLYVQAGPDAAPAPEPTPTPPPKPAPAVPAGLDLDFASFPPPPVASPTEEAAGSPFDFGDEPTPAPSAVKADANTLDFDLAGLSLELEEPARATPASGAGHEALATKLSLAEEFQAIGDVDGARSLIQEVLAEAQGDLRRRAERMLAELG